MGPQRAKDNRDEMSSFQKAWEVLFPWLLYYLARSAAYIILVFVREAVMEKAGGTYRRFMTEHEAAVAGVTGGLSMLIGILPLLPMLKRELFWRKGISASDAGKNRESPAGKFWITSLITCVLAFSSSLGLNALLTLTGFAESSQAYREVAQRQYSVAFAAGLVLYGLVSPFTEEVIFRGIICNRMRRHYGPVLAIVASGLCFGAFHGNLVQGVYGTCMGILMAYLYERSGRFVIPFMFHAVANLAVYITSYRDDLQSVLFTPAGCVILLAVFAGAVFIYEKLRNGACTDERRIRS